MKIALASALLATAASASVIQHRDGLNEAGLALDLAAIEQIVKRASPQAPNGYTPARVNCPSTRPSLRDAHTLSPEETAWLEKRRNATIDPMREWLTRMNITGFDANTYLDGAASNASILPNIGIAVSGGGYRALMNGAGNVAAFDSRTDNSTEQGHIGGLLQSATYIAGLSGGGWLVGSLYVNNFTSVQAMLDSNTARSGNLWQFQNGILSGPDTGGIQLLDTARYYANVQGTVSSKADAGFNTSITDYWGRMLSYQLINATDGGPAYTWSSLAQDADITSGNAPLPLLIADGRAPGETLIPATTTIFEFSPWEMGSWDPTVFGFAPIQYVGSNFSAGILPENEACIAGFDNAGYVMGTSSSLFNQALLYLNASSTVPDFLKNAILGVLADVGDADNDIADWTPNPFYHYHNATNRNAQSKRLTLVDGGEDNQNIPLHPLIQPQRHVDVIFAVDSTADTTDPQGPNWPTGSSLVRTYERSLNVTIENGTSFPSIPDTNTFVNLGLNTRPTMFGCDASNITGTAPLIVYLPNAPYVFNSNFSTFTMTYNISERNSAIENGYDVATMGNGTLDANWPTCVGCAVMSRSWTRTNTEVPEICQQCFTNYCWNGTIDSTPPAVYAPEPYLTPLRLSSGVERLLPNYFAAAAVVTAATFLYA